MISYIKGEIEYIAENYIIVDNNSIGYHMLVSPLTISKLQLGQSLKIFTYMSVREDSMTLFGFLSQEELNIFNLLISVSGIGPKGALMFLNTMLPSQITLAIISDDATTLSKVQGIGKKTAQKIILELKDKLMFYDVVTSESVSASVSNVERHDAIEAMISLGYKKNEATKAVLQVVTEGMTTEQILKAALRLLV